MKQVGFAFSGNARFPSPPRETESTRYPSGPGFQPSPTSHAAAQDMRSSAHAKRARVLDELRKAAGTADEIAARLGESVLAIRPRLTELKRDGVIEWTGEKRPNASGLLAKVWRAK